MLLMMGCGHSGSESGTYSETLTLADMEADEGTWDEPWSEDAEDDSAEASAQNQEGETVEESPESASSADEGSDSSQSSDDKKGEPKRDEDKKSQGKPERMEPEGEKPLPLMLPKAVDPDKKEKIVYNIPRGSLKVKPLGRLADVFNDSNYVHLGHAERLGIQPISSLRSLYKNRRPVVKVETNQYYEVDELTHSYPYLVPEAEKLLRDIGRGFQDSIAKRGGGKYRIIVTSVLRTPVTVKRLKRVNRNAVEQSTHQYGTTFDITYNRFSSPGDGKTVASEDMKNILAEVLYDLRGKGRCLVKYERKSPCFHITVTK